MMTDPIADMLTRIRNAVRVERPFVGNDGLESHAAWRKCSNARGSFGATRKSRSPHQSHLRIELKYGPSGEQVIRHLKRVSKPGRRVYSSAKDLRPVLNGQGITILSTSRGVLSDREARQQNLGGEVLCEVW
ncbi:MAG: 30S ribosomal protein S8 [Pirellulaceae bacterium]